MSTAALLAASSLQNTNKLLCDKSNDLDYAPSKDSDQTGPSPSV